MSFFYLSPVKGDMTTNLLETIVKNRTEFLASINKEEIPAYSEYLIEGSVYDNVGHFMLCIVVILCDNWTFSQFFVTAEKHLFRKRLNALSGLNLRLFAKKLLRSIKKQPVVFDLTNPLLVLCRHVAVKHVAQHIADQHDQECCTYSVRLHFKHCLNFIAKRQVELSNGTVSLPCGKWIQYITLLFQNNLILRLKTKIDSLQADTRIMRIVDIIKKDHMPPPLSRNINLIRSSEVDGLSQQFPPCMLNLHKHLRMKHRLSHEQRFQYSLFLKDIGMPVEEAISFWREEYQKHPDGNHSCTHQWERDQKKYVYGIRHMYGLEGARKKYSPANCQRIQASCNAATEGGCPFSFDETKMLPLLDSSVTKDCLRNIIELRSRGKFTAACKLYLNAKHFKGNDKVCDTYSFTPVKYYNISSNNNK